VGAKIHFNDSGRTATQKPNPKYPDGIDATCAKPGEESCCWNLPYPAPRCGTYSVVCETCHFTALVTVAGRPDDPRTLTMPCKRIRQP
jgi:hypothetical protein